MHKHIDWKRNNAVRLIAWLLLSVDVLLFVFRLDLHGIAAMLYYIPLCAGCILLWRTTSHERLKTMFTALLNFLRNRKKETAVSQTAGMLPHSLMLDLPPLEAFDLHFKDMGHGLSNFVVYARRKDGERYMWSGLITADQLATIRARIDEHQEPNNE